MRRTRASPLPANSHSKLPAGPAPDLLIRGAKFSTTGTAWMRFIADDSHLYALTGSRLGDHTEPPPRP